MLTIRKTSYLSLNMLLNVSAILMPPMVVTLTPIIIVLEFQAANGSATHSQVEYAKDKAASVLSFESGSRVTTTGRESTYQVSQTKLKPGETYHIRVVPLVDVSTRYTELFYRGIPSDTVKLMIPMPGRVCIILPYHLLSFSQRHSIESNLMHFFPTSLY